jgi:hypothetical protein
MAKKKNVPAVKKAATNDAPATLKDLLRPEVLDKLKAQADELKAEEENRREASRKAAADSRKAEEKRLENDFGHLLETSKQDWRKYK